MLKPPDESAEGERPELSRLIDRLAQDTRDWAAAEVALARLELGVLKAQLIRAGLFAAVALAALFCFFIALTEAGIALLAPLTGGAAVAALIVAVLVGCVFTASLFGLRRAFSWRGESIFFRWLGGAR